MLVKIIIILLLTAMCPRNHYKVIRVIDGDTIKVKELNKNIRILGIDTFETSNNYKLKQQAKKYKLTKQKTLKTGKQAKEFATKILLNKCVRLERDYRDVDRYNRYLRYVYINNSDYSEIMLKNNLAVMYCSDKRIKNYEKYNLISKQNCL